MMAIFYTTGDIWEFDLEECIIEEYPDRYTITKPETKERTTIFLDYIITIDIRKEKEKWCNDNSDIKTVDEDISADTTD